MVLRYLRTAGANEASWQVITRPTWVGSMRPAYTSRPPFLLPFFRNYCGLHDAC
jgi:hypothetical protein